MPTDLPSAGRAAGDASALGGTTEALLLGALGILWGSAFVSIREGILFGASPIAYASARYLLSAVPFGLLALLFRDPLPDRRALLVSASVGGVLVIGAYGGLLYWGEQYTTGGYAAVLAPTFPILTVLFAYFLLPSERLTPLSLAGIALGFVGAVVLVSPSLAGGIGGAGAGPLFVLLANVSTGVGTVLLRRFGGGRQGLYQIGAQFAVGGLLLAGVAALLPGSERLPFTPSVLIPLAALVLFSSTLGYFVYYLLHHRAGPIRASTVSYLSPLVAIGIGTGFFGEPVTGWEIGGFAIVLVGITLVLRGSLPPATAPSESRGTESKGG